MNCNVCGAPLQQNARFCPNCGTTVDKPHQENSPSASPLPYPASADATVRNQPQQPPAYSQQQAIPPWAPTQPTSPPPGTSAWEAAQAVPTYESQPNAPMSPFQPPAPLPYYQNNTFDRGANMHPISNTREETRPKRTRNRAGCLAGCLTGIVILLLVVGAGWIFLLRPYLHNVAETQIDNALTAGVQQIPTTLPTLPIASIPLPIQDNTINNLFVLNLAPNSPLKNPATQISPDGIRMTFQLYGFSNGIALKPTLQNGRLIATNVVVDGPFSWIMSSDELTPLLNRHLSDAQNRIKYSIQSIQLKDHEMDLTIGSGQTP